MPLIDGLAPHYITENLTCAPDFSGRREVLHPDGLGFRGARGNLRVVE
jgi:hypothetical protein